MEKILCITNDFGPRAGGIESFVIGLIERFPKHSVIVYTSSQDGSEAFDGAWNRNFGVEVIRDKSKVLLPTFRVGRNVRKIVFERKIESVFFGAAAPLGLLSQGLRKAGTRRIVALTHGHEVWWAKVWPFRIALKRIGAGVDYLTYLGPFTKDQISRALRESDRTKLIHIAPGIDTDHFSPQDSTNNLRASLGLTDKKVIVSVGRLVHRKGQDILIEALPQIAREVPNVHLLFIGEGPYRNELDNRINKLGLSDRVTFIGRVQFAELPRYFCAGDIFAMPSRSRLGGLEVEGLGIVYLEASACGLAVIGGISGGAPDAVLQGQTGFSVDGTSATDVASSAINLLSNQVLSQHLGENGRRWVVEQWRWEIWAAKFLELFK
jgi:phosphatidylinositol alpha-1,6-mannosyltransferase